MTEYKIGGIGYVLIEVESRYNDKTGFKGVNGKELVADTRYEPLKHVRTCGKVIQVPFAIGERMLRAEVNGMPNYGPVRAIREGQTHDAIYAIGGVYTYKRMSAIQERVKVGDTIWFQRLVLHRKENLVEEIETKKGKKFIFKVDYDLIVCIQKKEPVMVGGWCFLKPVQWDNLYMKTFYDYTDKDGNPVERPKEQWLKILKPPPGDRIRATLKHFGQPVKGDTFYFKKEAEVFLRQPVEWSNHGWRYLYNGEEYILTKQWDIVAELVEEN